MAGHNRNRPWSDLPQELLSAIANFLTSNPISIFTFRSICHSWRSSCPPLTNSSILSPHLPLSIPIPLPSNSYYPFSDYTTSSLLSVTTIYALRRPLQLSESRLSSLSPGAWILFVDEFIPGKLSIRKPFSNGSYSTPINFPNNVDLIDSGFRELGFQKCDLGLDVSVCHLQEADRFGDIESFPGYSDSLWPPPSWLWSIDRLKRIGIVETAIDGILDKLPEDYKADTERADYLKAAVLDFVKSILKLKEMAVRFREEEIEFKDKLHEEDGSFEQARTSSHATTEETLGKPDNLETNKACNEWLRVRDTYLFFIEEQVTEQEISLKSRLALIKTLLA